MKNYLFFDDGSNTVRVKFDPVCEIGATPYPRLYEALASVGYGETKTIKLLEDIDYNTGIVITGRTIIFDMNGHTLTVVSSTENGLEVGSGGIVDVTGSGAFNVVSTADNMYGVYAHDGRAGERNQRNGNGRRGIWRLCE